MIAKLISRTGDGKTVIEVDDELLNLLTPENTYSDELKDKPAGYKIRLHDYIRHAKDYTIRLEGLKRTLGELYQHMTRGVTY